MNSISIFLVWAVFLLPSKNLHPQTYRVKRPDILVLRHQIVRKQAKRAKYFILEQIRLPPGNRSVCATDRPTVLFVGAKRDFTGANRGFDH